MPSRAEDWHDVKGTLDEGIILVACSPATENFIKFGDGGWARRLGNGSPTEIAAKLHTIVPAPKAEGDDEEE